MKEEGYYDYNNVSVTKVYFQNLYSKQLDNIEKIDGFLDM